MRSTPMQEYVVNIAGQEHTLQLSQEDAEKYPDAKPVGEKQTDTDTKSRTAQNK
jgi:hypothetical protein